jgi:hypothetical protein
MSNQIKPKKLIQVSNVDALMADGTRLSWQAFRPAEAKPGAKPTVYVVTLPANLAQDASTSLYNLKVVGAQSTTHRVEITFRDNASATVKLPDGQTIRPGIDVPIILPIIGPDGAASLTFTGEQCSFQARPLEGEGGDGLQSGDDGDPPPPYPH